MSDTTDPDAPPAPSRVRIIQAAPRPCAQCPWRTRNQTRVDRHGFYSLANLQRLWEGLRDGERMACHPTDPAMAEFTGYEQTASRRQTHECAGALVLIHRELHRLHTATKQTAPGDALALYRDTVGELALTSKGIASHAFALLAGRPPLCGGVEVRRVDLTDADSAMPGLPGWGESPLDSASVT
jgi:hypothetical protein